MIAKNNFIVIGRNNQKQNIQILLDTGAPSSIITESMAARLNQLEDYDPEGIFHQTRILKDLIGTKRESLGCCQFDILLEDNRTIPTRLDIIPDWNKMGDKHNPGFEILLGANFFEANHIGLDLEQLFPVSEDYIPDAYTIQIFIERPNEERIRFAYSTEVATVPPSKPTLHWWTRIDELFITGPKGQLKLRCAINPSVFRSLIVQRAADQLVEYLPILNEKTEYDRNAFANFIGMSALDTIIDGIKMHFCVNIVDDVPHDVDVIFGYPEIQIWGLMMKAGKIVITHPDPIINL